MSSTRSARRRTDSRRIQPQFEPDRNPRSDRAWPHQNQESHHMKTVSEIVRLGPVIPVLAFDSVEQGEHVSRALHAGGVKVLEITLRTPAGLEAIQRASQLADDI